VLTVSYSSVHMDGGSYFRSTSPLLGVCPLVPPASVVVFLCACVRCVCGRVTVLAYGERVGPVRQQKQTLVVQPE
jgi:hypothetical protein